MTAPTQHVSPLPPWHATPPRPLPPSPLAVASSPSHTALFAQTLLPTTRGSPTFRWLRHKSAPPRQPSFQHHTTRTLPPFCSLHRRAGLSPLLPCFCVRPTLDHPLTNGKSGQWARSSSFFCNSYVPRSLVVPHLRRSYHILSASRVSLGGRPHSYTQTATTGLLTTPHNRHAPQPPPNAHPTYIRACSDYVRALRGLGVRHPARSLLHQHGSRHPRHAHQMAAQQQR